MWCHTPASVAPPYREVSSLPELSCARKFSVMPCFMSPMANPGLLPVDQSLLLTTAPSPGSVPSDWYQNMTVKSPVPNWSSSGAPKSIYCSAVVFFPAISSGLLMRTALPDTPSTNSTSPVIVPLFPATLSVAAESSKVTSRTGASFPVPPVLSVFPSSFTCS